MTDKMEKNHLDNSLSPHGIDQLSYKYHPDAIYAMNLEGKIINANQATSKLLSYSIDELLNLSYENIISSEEFETFRYYFKKAFEGEVHKFKTAIICKNRKKIEATATTVPIEIDGQIVNVYAYINEITEQKETERKIQTSKELCKSFIDNHDDPILLLDLDATIVLINQAFSRLLGWRKENLEGLNILCCPSIPPYLVEQMKDYHHRIAMGKPVSAALETIRITNEGKVKHIMLSITPIHDWYGKVYNWAVHLRDVTAQKEMENFLFQSEKLLTVGQLAASVTHEIRNPLTSLKGFIQLSRTSEGQTECFSKYLDIMLKELKQIETFVDELSVLAKTQVKSYKKTNIISLLQDILSLLRTQALTNNVYIKYEHEPVCSIFCEEKQLRQALFNVIQNGIEAMPDGGILYVRIKPYDESYLKIEVTDHGMGIPEDRLLKLGEPFYSTKEKGTGLGLTLTYKIIENHQGTITIQSQVGCGTTVTILLPVTKQNIEQAMIGCI